MNEEISLDDIVEELVQFFKLSKITEDEANKILLYIVEKIVDVINDKSLQKNEANLFNVFQYMC